MNNDNSKALYQCQNCGMTFGPESAQLSVEEIRREAREKALKEAAEICWNNANGLNARDAILALIDKPAETKP